MFERLAIGAVADGVHAQLVAVLRSRAAPSCGCRRPVVGVQPGAVRLVAVRLEQPRAARAERAVDRALDARERSDGRCRSRSSGTARAWPRAARWPRAPSPRGARRSLPSSTSFFIRSIVANGEPASWKRRDALRERLRRSASSSDLARARLALRCRRLAGAALDQPLRRLAQQAGRVAVRVLQDLAARRVRPSPA